MENNLNQNHYDRGIEIALGANDLSIRAKSRILEGRSTTGFPEKPGILPTQRATITNRMVQVDQAWLVEMSWQVFGPLACLLSCGFWECKLIFEQMGAGETSFSPRATVQDIGQAGHTYQTAINIAPGSLKPGVYKVICCLQFHFENGTPGPIAGFEDKGFINVFEDKRVYTPYAAAAPVTNGVGS